MELKLGQWACVVKNEGKTGRTGEGVLIVTGESIQLLREDRVVLKIKYNLLAMDRVQKTTIDNTPNVDLFVDPYHVFLAPAGPNKEEEINKFLQELTTNLANYASRDDMASETEESEAQGEEGKSGSKTETAPEPRKPSVLKGLLKQAGKKFKKAVISATGEFVEDKVSDLTGSKDLGNLTGKVTSNVLEEFSTPEESGEQNPEELSRGKIVSQESKEAPPPVDLPRRLLGILRVKRSVTVEYIKEVLKISREEIIGIIYDLVGNGTITGEFDENDAKFTLH